MVMAAHSRVVVREAEVPDLDRVVEVLRAANAEFEEVLPPAFYRAYLANVVDVRSRLAESQLLLAEREERIVAAITLYPDATAEGWGWPRHWTGIRAVGVEPSARGLGKFAGRKENSLFSATLFQGGAAHQVPSRSRHQPASSRAQPKTPLKRLKGPAP